jgi:two-component system, NarL family, response regulator LiaR
MPGQAAGADLNRTASDGLPARILLVDDSPTIRRHLRQLLEPSWIVCGEASNGEEGIEQCRSLHPDLVILDVVMPVMNGIDAAEKMRQLFPQTPLLMVSAHGLRRLCELARDIGVSGYVLKADAGRTLVDAVDAVLRHELHFPPADYFHT